MDLNRLHEELDSDKSKTYQMLVEAVTETDFHDQMIVINCKNKESVISMRKELLQIARDMNCQVRGSDYSKVVFINRSKVIIKAKENMLLRGESMTYMVFND